MGKQIVSNKYLQINRWADPTEKGVVTLEIEKIDLEKLDKDDIVVKIKYACIHPADLMVIQGLYKGAYNVKNNILPSKFGFEGFGEIIQVGSSVTDYKVGQKVLAELNDKPSSYQQYAIVKNAMNIKIPENLPDEVKVQFFINPYTAVGLLDVLGLMKGQQNGWLVQNGANSTVGRLVHVIAKIKGVKSVALVRKQDAVKMMKDLGADKVLVVGHLNSADEYAKAILDATEGKGAQYAIDCVGGDIAGLGLYKSMASDSYFAVYGALSGKIFLAEGLPNPKSVKLSLFQLPVWNANKSQEYIQSLVDELYQYYAEGKLHLPIEEIFSIDNFEAAFEFQVNNAKSRTGKALFKMI